jgi:hypothetical protein
MTMNKNIGLILLTIGIGVTAGFGAVLAPDFRKATLASGQATMAISAADALHADYCALRKEFKLADADGCGDSPPLVGTPAEKLAILEQRREVLLVQVSKARVNYQIALKKCLKFDSAVSSIGTQGPRSRLSGWFKAGGAGFGLGLGFLVAGAWICRKEASVYLDDEGDDSPGVVDFGTLLVEVSEAAAALRDGMAATEAPTEADADRFKAMLEDIQKDALARLCASGPRVQARYGLQGMAALFSPLSGAERRLNRTWAALVDRHWPEALDSVTGAVANLDETREALSELTA